MNIFVLDINPRIAAIYHNDAHLTKMILETAQLLSTAHRVLDGTKIQEKHPRTNRLVTRYKLENDSFYQATHINHPCAIWTRSSAQNYIWLNKLFISLGEEFRYRRNKDHKTYIDLKDLLSALPKNIPHIGLTPFAQAMPDKYKDADAVKAYRNYYIHEKNHLAKWSLRSKPDWYYEEGVINAYL
jgi:hypothetical protein